MATTSNTYTGNGTNKLFSITFEYLNVEDIDVYVNDVLQTITTQYSFANATTIEFVTAPANGAEVVLNRTTDDTAFQATFFPGSPIKAADLNDNFDQVLFLTQEAANLASESIADSATALASSTTALATANSADDKADLALSSVSSLIDYIPVANLTALAALTPVNGNFYELADSTGVEGSALVQSVPAGFVGSAGLSVRLKYEVPPSKFTFLSYYANDSETRYVKTSTGGTAAAPAYSFNADTNTGVFRPTADTVAVSTSGTERVRVNSSGQVAISLGDVDSGTPQPWPTANDTIYPPTLTLQNWYYQCLVLTDSPASAGNDTRYGIIAGPRYNPTHKAFSGFGVGDSGSQRDVYVGGGNWNCPDANGIYFYTAPTYNETDDQGVLRASFTSDGYLRMAANTGGIQFNGDTAATNALDDYEEGTFTPLIRGSTTAGTTTGSLVGEYVKIGKVVYYSIYASWSGGTGTGNLLIRGLPFTPNFTNTYYSASISYFNGVALTANHVPMAELYDVGQIDVYSMPTGGGTMISVAYDAAGEINLSGLYITT